MGLVDSWNLPDFVLGSVLGERGGDVYRRYFGAVEASRYQQMNQEGKPFYWNAVIKPLLHGNQRAVVKQ